MNKCKLQREEFKKYCDDKRLGDTQRRVLDSLIDHGSWSTSDMCGWTWDTRSNTLRVMESLTRKGAADQSTDTIHSRVIHTFVPSFELLDPPKPDNLCDFTQLTGGN
jgi:hypothetical protein